MEKIKSYLKIVIGSILIAFSLNIFFKNMSLVPAGILGLSTIYNFKVDMDFGLILLLIDIFFLALAWITLPQEKTKKSILPFLLIPAFTYLLMDLDTLIDVSTVDTLLMSIYGGVLIGLGNSFIYKENRYSSGSDIISSIEKEVTGFEWNFTNYAIDLLILLIAMFMFGIESAMYSLVSIVVIEILSKRASLGTSDSKVFYIITKKDREVRDYILNELHYELTVFDVKGGFLKTKNTVLMTVIPTKDYYKLREGTKAIDPKAFISITDSYEVINQNKSLKMISKEKNDFRRRKNDES